MKIYNNVNTYVHKGGPLGPNIPFFTYPIKTRKYLSPNFVIAQISLTHLIFWWRKKKMKLAEPFSR